MALISKLTANPGTGSHSIIEAGLAGPRGIRQCQGSIAGRVDRRVRSRGRWGDRGVGEKEAGATVPIAGYVQAVWRQLERQRHW